MTTTTLARSDATRERTAPRTREAMLTAAAGLKPWLKEHAEHADHERRVTREAVDKLLDAGLFDVVVPKAWGGADLGFAALVETAIEIAEACPSTGWVYGVLAGHSWLLNLFPGEAQGEILSDRKALTATVFRMGGQVTPAKDGYLFKDGKGGFCSGIDHASWVILGAPVTHPDGRSEPRFFVVPKRELEVVDDWFTVGMRGTGSRTIRLAEAFIPDHRSVSVADMSAGGAPNSPFRQSAAGRPPFSDFLPFSIIGAPLGAARGAVKRFTEDLEARLKSADDQQLAEASVTLARAAEAAAAVDAAITLVLDTARRVDAATGPLDALERARIPRNWAYGVHTARRAVNSLFEAAGGSSIYDSSAFQRLWRDANAGAQHFAFTWDTAMASYGRAAIGRAPSAYGLKPSKVS